MKTSLQYTSNSKTSPSILSSAINSRKSSKSKLLAIQKNDSHNQKQCKIDIISLKKSLKQSRPHNIYNQKVQFEQSDTKLKKNLMKQFQTFNINQNDQQQQKSTKNQKKSQKKHTKSRQRTTQAKSPLSKTKLSRKSQIQARTQHIQREKQQSQVRKSSISQQKRLDDKKQFQDPQNKNSQQPYPTKQNNFHLNFPQLITESQQAYPNSSYPNTGKHKFRSQQNHDYISQETQSHQQYQETSLQDKSLIYFRKGKSFSLPKSYIIAMQILQQKVQTQQSQIQQLKTQLNHRNHKLNQVQNKYAALKHQYQNQNQSIQNKNKQIGFLKGYLDEVKQNNRQALKQVSRNVYQRSLSNFAKRDNQINNQQPIQLINKQKQILRQKQELDHLEIQIQNRKQIEQDILHKTKLNANRISLNNLNRPRSISTAIKPSIYQNSDRKPRRYQYLEQGKQKLKPAIIDRMTDKNYIKKSVTSKYLYANSQQKQQIEQKQRTQKLLNNKVQVSEMREIMRNQKQLVALNYKLQAIQTKIFNYVKSPKQTPRQQLKYNKFQSTNQKDLVLDNLKKQYNLLKREVEIKQNQIKALRFNMDKEQNVQGRLTYNYQL